MTSVSTRADEGSRDASEVVRHPAVGYPRAMIRHVVLFRWKPEIPAGQVERITAALSALPARIPEIAAYSCGPNLGIAANWHYGIAADFATIDDYRVYDVHADHEAARAGTVRPWIAERAVAQFELTPI